MKYFVGNGTLINGTLIIKHIIKGPYIYRWLDQKVAEVLNGIQSQAL